MFRLQSAILILSFCLLGGTYLKAQDDLLDMLEDLEEETIDYTYATFKGVRIVNAHSIEIPAPGVLQLLISHRFGRLNGGPYELFGLDQANIRIGFEYGLSNHLSIGVGRSNIKKTYDGFVKLKLLRQSTGKRKFPFSVAALSGIAVNTLRWQDPDLENYYSSRLAYSHQLLIARKFSESFSLQLMPTLVHRNLVSTAAEDNDVIAIGGGGRWKFLPSVSINFEYFYILPSNTADNFENSLSLGFDIETGGHVFQLIFSNSRSMTENLFVAETTGEWGAGDIHFGFNVGRVFTVADKARNKSQARKERKKEKKKEKDS